MCETLGFAHPDYLTKQLTAQQLSDWHAYYLRTGLGSDRSDLYYAQLIALVANFGRPEHQSPYRAEEFLLYRDQYDTEITVEELRAKLGM